MPRHAFLVLALLIPAGCSSERKPAADAAPPPVASSVAADRAAIAHAHGDVLEEVRGDLSVGDAKILYTAHVDSTGAARCFHVENDYGEHGWARSEFVVDDEAGIDHRRTESARANDPSRAGAMDSVAVTLRLDARGTVLAGEKTVNGAAAPVDPADALGAIRQLWALECDLAAHWTERNAPDTRALAGSYRAELPAASSPGREITLHLGSDHLARLTSDYRNGQPPVVQEGTWTGRGDSGVVTRFRFLGGKPANLAPIVFDFAEDAVAAVQYDRTTWGSAGLVLARAEDYTTLPVGVTGVAWRWIAFESSGEGAEDGSITVEDPSRYTLTFLPEGQVAVRADCNRGMGRCRVADGRTVTIGPVALTRAMCPPGSLDAQFLALLQGGPRTIFLEGGKLSLEFPADAGSMRFEPGAE